MPDETRAIEPALSDVQWQRRMVQGLDVSDGDKGLSIMLHGSQLVIADSWYKHTSDANYVCLRDPAKLAAAMALANAALPDGDPRKITRDDIRLLWEVANSQEFCSEDIDDRGRDHFDNGDKQRIAALSAKLAAFLPPEQ